jgi:DNA-binding XRE family transcriptional regulator
MTQPATTTATTWTRDYPGQPDQVRLIRRDLLTGCPSADDIVLCASELATNAIQHSRSALPGGHITVRATLTPGRYVRIKVTDQGGRWDWTGRTPRHHGLHVIHCTAVNWGISGDYRSRTTWALLHWQLCLSIYAAKIQPPTATSPAAMILRATRTRGPVQWSAVIHGPHLRDLRQAHHFTRRQLGYHAGISPHTIGRLERQDQARAATRTMARLAIALGEHPAAFTLTVTRLVRAVPSTEGKAGDRQADR